jgi:hypothetical protein
MFATGPVRLTIPIEIVPFNLDDVHTDGDDNSPVKALGCLAELVIRKIVCHTDDCVLWNRYAQRCLEKGGSTIKKFYLAFKDCDRKSFGVLYPPHFWCILLKSGERILVSFCPGTEPYRKPVFNTKRMLQQTSLTRGYVVFINLCYSASEDGAYCSNVATVTEVSNVACRYDLSSEEEDGGEPPARSHLAPAAIQRKCGSLSRRKRKSPRISTSTVTEIRDGMPLYDLTSDDGDSKLPANPNLLFSNRIQQGQGTFQAQTSPLTVHGVPCKMCGLDYRCHHHQHVPM